MEDISVATFPAPIRSAPPIRLSSDEAPKQLDLNKTLVSVYLTLKATQQADVHIMIGQNLPIELDRSVAALLGNSVSFHPMNTSSLFGILCRTGRQKTAPGPSVMIAVGSERSSITLQQQNLEDTAKRLLPDEKSTPPMAARDGRIAAPEPKLPPPEGASHHDLVVQDGAGNFKVISSAGASATRSPKGIERQSGWLLGGFIWDEEQSQSSSGFKTALLSHDPRKTGGFDFSAVGAGLRKLTSGSPAHIWTTGLGPHLTAVCLRSLRGAGAIAQNTIHFMPDQNTGASPVATCLEMLVRGVPGDLLLDFSGDQVRGVIKC